MEETKTLTVMKNKHQELSASLRRRVELPDIKESNSIMSLNDFQRRIAAVERAIGMESSNDRSSSNETAASNDDLLRRLDLLEHELASKLRPYELQEILSESETLLEEVNPGPALTYQTNDGSGPMLYRRQAVVASAPEAMEALNQLSDISSLLSIGQNFEGKSKQLSDDQVRNAPILAVRVAAEQQQCFDSCVRQLGHLQQRAEKSASELDAILDEYQRLVTATSTKMLTLDQELKALQRSAVNTKTL